MDTVQETIAESKRLVVEIKTDKAALLKLKENAAPVLQALNDVQPLDGEPPTVGSLSSLLAATRLELVITETRQAITEKHATFALIQCTIVALQLTELVRQIREASNIEIDLDPYNLGYPDLSDSSGDDE
jgi:hypothetical protein